MLNRTIKIINGNLIQNYKYYKCDQCGNEMDESFPMWRDGDIHYCWDCTFKRNLVSEREYLDVRGFGLDTFHANINDSGEICVWCGNETPPSERVYRNRHEPEHKEWRDAIFKRDNYTCRRCYSIGGHLQAHHIKPYAKYEELRYELSNGICLCEYCHKEEHRRRASNG